VSNEQRMTPSEQPKVWPRTVVGYCSCPYCSAIREGDLKVPETQSVWAQRMGAPR
jgi:hypothetical protein